MFSQISDWFSGNEEKDDIHKMHMKMKSIIDQKFEKQNYKNIETLPTIYDNCPRDAKIFETFNGDGIKMNDLSSFQNTYLSKDQLKNAANSAKNTKIDKDAIAKSAKEKAKKLQEMKDNAQTAFTESIANDSTANDIGGIMDSGDDPAKKAQNAKDAIRKKVKKVIDILIYSIERPEEMLYIGCNKFIEVIGGGKYSDDVITHDTFWVYNYIKQIAKIFIGCMIAYNLFYIANFMEDYNNNSTAQKFGALGTFYGWIQHLIWPFSIVKIMFQNYFPAIINLTGLKKYAKILFVLMTILCVWYFFKNGYLLKQYILDMFEWKTSGTIMFLLVLSVLSNLNFIPPLNLIDLFNGKTIGHVWGTINLITSPFGTLLYYVIPSLVVTFTMAPVAQALFALNVLMFILGVSIYNFDKLTPYGVIDKIDKFVQREEGDACEEMGFMRLLNIFVKKIVYENIFKFVFLMFFIIKLITGFSSGLATMEMKVGFGFINFCVVLWLSYKIIINIFGIEIEKKKDVPWGDMKINLDDPPQT